MSTSPPDVKIPDTYEEFLELCPEPDPEPEAPAEEVGASSIPPLILADRCCACSAQARVRGVFPGDETPWDFCKHHYEASALTLEAKGFEVLDDQPLKDLYTEDRKKGEL